MCTKCRYEQSESKRMQKKCRHRKFVGLSMHLLFDSEARALQVESSLYRGIPFVPYEWACADISVSLRSTNKYHQLIQAATCVAILVFDGVPWPLRNGGACPSATWNQFGPQMRWFTSAFCGLLDNNWFTRVMNEVNHVDSNSLHATVARIFTSACSYLVGDQRVEPACSSTLPNEITTIRYPAYYSRRLRSA